MRTKSMFFLVATLWLPISAAFAQNPANEHNCPSARGIAEAEPPYVGSGGNGFSPNQSLCLPRLAPAGGSNGPLAFIVQGVEPGIRVDSQGTIYINSIRGVPGGADLWRWDPSLGPDPDGGPNSNGTLPFRYEGQPDNCGILTNGCANNVGTATNPGVAPGGGDADIAVNGPDPANTFGNVPVPNVAFVSLSLADVTAAQSKDRGDTFSAGTSTATGGLINLANPFAAEVPGDDRMWIDAYDDSSTVYMNYHDLATFNIDVQRSIDGGATYTNGIGEAIDATTFPSAGAVTPLSSANVAGQIRIDKNTNGCPSRGNLYQIFVAPDNPTENTPTNGSTAGGPLRTVYIGVSTDAKNGASAFTFTDHKIYTSPIGSPGAINGTNQVFPALATDDNGFVYAVWSDNTNIYFSSSATQGVTWTPAVVVNHGSTDGKARVFPWIAADANGHAVVVWLGADKVGNSNDPVAMGVGTGHPARWNVYAAETVNGNGTSPKFTQYTASDHVIHTGTVSTGGLGGGADRSLADFFQVALDQQHRANITYADNHDTSNDHVGVPYFTRQLATNPDIVFPTGPGSCFSPVQ